MTAISVELFPCRVQLLGLPRCATSISSATSTSANSVILGKNFRSFQKVQRVSRNLFGSPDPIEMKNLYQQEAERQRKYVLRRYNFDTKSAADANEENGNENSLEELRFIKNTKSSPKQPNAYPTLIEQELKQHDQRLQCGQQSLCRTALEKTPSNTKICSHANRISKATRSCCEYSTTLSSTGVDSQKPYTRQSLLTDKFKVRKSKLCVSRHIKCNRVGVTKRNSLKETRNLEIPQLLDNNDCNVTHEDDTKSICNKNCVCTLDANDQNSNSALDFKDEHTAVSLQLVVSTQNLTRT